MEEDIDYIKTKVVNNEPMIPKPPKPRAAKSLPETEKPVHAHVEPQKPKSPPLFVKIDKYRDIVQNIQKLKSYSLGLRDALEALTDIESELKTGLSITQKALDNFNTIISMLDAKLLRIEGLEDLAKTNLSERGEIDHYLNNLYEQIERIKHELRAVK